MKIYYSFFNIDILSYFNVTEIIFFFVDDLEFLLLLLLAWFCVLLYTNYSDRFVKKSLDFANSEPSNRFKKAKQITALLERVHRISKSSTFVVLSNIVIFGTYHLLILFSVVPIQMSTIIISAMMIGVFLMNLLSVFFNKLPNSYFLMILLIIIMMDSTACISIYKASATIRGESQIRITYGSGESEWVKFIGKSSTHLFYMDKEMTFTKAVDLNNIQIIEYPISSSSLSKYIN